LGFNAIGNAQETKPTKLVVQITGTGFETIKVEHPVDFARPLVVDTVTKIPVGNNRRVSIWAVDKNGVTTHIDTLESRKADIGAGTAAPVYATLIPATGSIYLLFTGLSTSVDSVRATFTKTDRTLVAKSHVKRASKTYMSLDNIPHNTTGLLRVEIVAATEEVLYVTSKELTFNARGNSNIDLRFMTPDGTVRRFAAVEIAAKGYLVIGRQPSEYVDIYPPTTSGLPITTIGNWITIASKDGTVIDRIICTGSNNALGWPSVSGKRSVERMKDKYAAADNNYGKHWIATTAGAFNAAQTLYGTPGRGADF